MGRKSERYLVVYRFGGRERCEWRETLERFASKAEARPMVERLEQAGYKALVFSESQLRANGLPEGWEWSTSEYQREMEYRERNGL